MRCIRCDHHIEYCECLTPAREVWPISSRYPPLAPGDVFIDVGFGRPVVIRPKGRLASVGLVAAFLFVPVVLVLLPLLGAIAFSGMSNGPTCWHQVAGFLGGTFLAVGLVLATPYLLLYYASRNVPSATGQLTRNGRA